MVLHYKFEYVSNNNMLLNILNSFSKRFGLEYKITRENDIINLFVKSSLETLEEFSDTLSHFVPMSIFFKNIDVHNVEELPSNSLEIKDDSPQLTFCQDCLKEVEDKESKDYYNPFIHCDQCGQNLEVESFGLYDGMNLIERASYMEYFEYVAKLIHDGKKIKIQTFSGEFVFARVENIKDNYQDHLKILCTNLNQIHEMCVATKSEVVALASVEKPSIDLKLNEIYKAKEIIKNPKVNVRYANDMILYLLSRELEKYNINFLYYLDVAKFDYALNFKTKEPIKTIDIPKISILENGQTLILESKNYPKRLDEVYSKFEDKNKSQFMVLLTENYLYKKSILNFYVSSLHDDCISLYSEELGMLDILNYQLPSSIEDIFAVIEQDETGARLIENYKKKFPTIYESARCFNLCALDKNSVFSLWKVVSLVLGFEQSVLDNANDAVLEKGPRIDYKFLEEKEEIYAQEFDIFRLIRSGMSYKLAGVDDKTLCLGYVESFAHFISRTVDMVNDKYKLDGVSLCGDLFADRVISHFVHKSITKNYKIYYNKDFAIQKN